MFRRRGKENEPSMLKQLTVADGSSTRYMSTIRISAIGGFLFAVIIFLAVFGKVWMDRKYVFESISVPYLVMMILVAIYILLAVQVASQWEKAVILRLGKYLSLKGPGMFWIIPIVDNVANWIDHRVNVTPFSAEKTLTKDTIQFQHHPALFHKIRPSAGPLHYHKIQRASLAC